MSTPTESSAGLTPINEALRRRLQSWFNAGKEKTAAATYDYATDLFVQCVNGDPANLEYMRGFMQNLYKKYNNNKKGASFSGLKGGSNKSGLKKAIAEKNWKAALSNGLELLKINPWDSGALLQIATAVGGMQCYDTQLGYLKAAFDAAPKDIDVARACARALAYLGDFDQAIAMWHEVEKINKNDPEAPREISNLQRDKLMGIPPKRPAAAGPAAPQPNRMNAPTQEELDAKEKEKAAATAGTPKIQLTPIQELQKQIQQDPVILFPYLKLDDLYVAEDKFADAEKTLRSALDVSGRDIKVQEKMEDVAMKRERNKVQIAEQRAAKDPTEHNKELAQNLRNELMRQEMEVYRVRSDRYPDVARWKYELGTRLKRLGNLPEAIKMLEEAKNDEHRRSYILLDLGECQQHLKQYEPAYESFVAGIEAVPSQNTDLRKLLLYRAGVLAVGLKRYDEGEKHLGKLASLDFNYKDVADRLDKLNKMRHKE